MATSGETIYAALFARLQAKVTLCKTFKRKWVQAQDFGVEQQPALLCLEGDEAPQTDPDLPSVLTMEAVVVVYVRTNDVEVPGTALSNILDQIKGALDLQPNEGGYPIRAYSSIGLPGVVDRAFIAGPIEKEDGSATGGQGWFTVPIHIVVNPGA